LFQLVGLIEVNGISLIKDLTSDPPSPPRSVSSDLVTFFSFLELIMTFTPSAKQPLPYRQSNPNQHKKHNLKQASLMSKFDTNPPISGGSDDRNTSSQLAEIRHISLILFLPPRIICPTTPTPFNF
jgi:hypothetical protein